MKHLDIDKKQLAPLPFILKPFLSKIGITDLMFLPAEESADEIERKCSAVSMSLPFDKIDEVTLQAMKISKSVDGVHANENITKLNRLLKNVFHSHEFEIVQDDDKYWYRFEYPIGEKLEKDKFIIFCWYVDDKLEAFSRSKSLMVNFVAKGFKEIPGHILGHIQIPCTIKGNLYLMSLIDYISDFASQFPHTLSSSHSKKILHETPPTYVEWDEFFDNDSLTQRNITSGARPTTNYDSGSELDWGDD